jgi:hypothetical protein
MAAGDETFANWNSAIAQVIGALETDDLPRLLVDALKTRVPFEFALVILYRLTDVAPERRARKTHFSRQSVALPPGKPGLRRRAA